MISEVVQLGSDTLELLPVLYEQVHGRKCPPDYFRLKYDTAFTGAQYIGYVALENKIPLAYYGVIPVMVSVNNEPVLAAQSCDTMTHPRHRNKGLFVQLAKLTLELAGKKGIHFVFGFPNKNSYPGFIKHLGFRHTETMNRYTISFSKTILRKLYRKLLVSLPANGRSIENRLLLQGFDGVLYSDAYLHYKHYNQNRILTSNDKLYWINTYGHLFVGAMSDEREEALPEQIAFLSKRTKASSATFIISPGTQLDKSLSRLYTAEEGFPVIIKNISGKFSTDNLKFQFADIDIF